MLVDRKCWKCGAWMRFVPNYLVNPEVKQSEQISYAPRKCVECGSKNKLGKNLMFAERCE